MYGHILVPLDGSERAERALLVAARVARASGACITLVQALTVPMPIGSPYNSALLSGSWIESEELNATAYLTRISGWPLVSGLSVDTKISVKTPAAAILDTAHDMGADLIIMCSHGRTGPSRWLLGSVAEHVARHASAPVLVLRESGPIPAGPHPDPEQPMRLLVPLDGSKLAEAALRPACELISALAGPRGGALHLTVALTPLEIDARYMPEGLALEGARTYLAEAADRVRICYPQLVVTWSVSSGFDTSETLLRTAETGEDVAGAGAPSRCDLIAMATHGHTGLARWALGSITERVLHASTLPLLIVRPSVIVSELQRAPSQQPVAAQSTGREL
jgi:nucleotide-binding universal stress UspA family protein